MTLRFALLAFSIGCAGGTGTPDSDTQPAITIDFEDGLPAEGVDLTDHSTDGGVWLLADVSAHGEGLAAAHLTSFSDGGSSPEAGFAVVGMHPVDLVGPAVFSMDIAFPGRPYNAPQRLEVILNGTDGTEQVDYQLDEVTETWLSDGTGDFVPGDSDWMTLEVPLDAEALGGSVQITLKIVEDFAGLRPDLYVDNLSVGPR